MSWKHPYQRMQLLSPQSSTDSITDPKQEEERNPRQEPAITVATAPVVITNTAQSAHRAPVLVAHGSASPLSEHAASLTFPSLSDSGSEEVGPTVDSPGELRPRVKVCTRSASEQLEGQELTKDVNHEQAATPPESNKPSPLHQLDHLQPQQGTWEGHEPANASEEGSLTLTETSDREEEVEEELTEVSEDTVFEETLPTTGKLVHTLPDREEMRQSNIINTHQI